MQLVFVVFSFVIVAGNAAIWNPEEENRSLSGDLALGEARLATGTSLSAATGVEFVAYIEEGTTFLGAGIVVNKYFVLTMTNVVANKIATNLKVYAGRVDPQKATSTDGVMRKGKDIKHKVADGSKLCSATVILDCVSLIRVCPSFAALNFNIKPDTAAPPTPYQDPTKTVNMYMYQAPNPAAAGTFPLAKATKNIGELCECKDITDFDKTKHVCLTEHATIKGDNTDETKALVVTSSDNSKIVGFLVKQQTAAGGQGEVVLYLNNYASFISTDGSITPYEYP